MANKALLVGINDYKKVRDLRGCINDVSDVRFTLTSLYGFNTSQIRVLTDARATKENILVRLNWLLDGAKKGDTLIFHFSGHGSQIRDRNGDELDDGLDEILCPYDMDWDGSYIVDDELGEIFSDVPEGVILEVFLDCCHSGTATRDLGLEPPPDLAPPSADSSIVDRFLPPPMDIYFRQAGEEEQLKQRGFVIGFQKRKKVQETTKHVLWSGCMANQTSADAPIGGRFHGAFTYYLHKHLRREKEASRDVLLKKVRSSLEHNQFTQRPQLEVDDGSLDQPILKAG